MVVLPSKITKLAASVVKIYVSSVSVIEANYTHVLSSIQVSDHAPDYVCSYIGAISEMACMHRVKVIERKISQAGYNLQR